MYCPRPLIAADYAVFPLPAKCDSDPLCLEPQWALVALVYPSMSVGDSGRPRALRPAGDMVVAGLRDASPMPPRHARAALAPLLYRRYYRARDRPLTGAQANFAQAVIMGRRNSTSSSRLYACATVSPTT
jgi:hypothetical protein